LIIVVFIFTSCHTKNEQKHFLFDDTELMNDSLTVKSYNEYESKNTFFTITDSLVIKEIFQAISKHSKNDYIEFIPTNYSDSFFDFKVTQNKRKFLISTGKIKEPKKPARGYVDVLRKENRGYIPEGSFYCDTLFEIMKKYNKRR
tara:strand:+ start:55318 stop:55752 length:435 start_codon:yes stop_codon:yes gene_type:complete